MRIYKYNLDDYIGVKISSLTATGVTKRIGKHTYWGFQCECGSPLMYKAPSEVILGRKKCCRQCWSNWKEGVESWLYKGTKNIPLSVMSNIEARCRKAARFIENTLTVHDVQSQWDKQEGKCAYTGRQLKFAKNTKGNASVDRIDSSRGYTPDNIQIVYKAINNMKQQLSHEDFLMLCKEVTKYGPEETNN